MQVVDSRIHASIRAGILGKPQLFVADDRLGRVEWEGDTHRVSYLNKLEDISDVSEHAIPDERPDTFIVPVEVPFPFGKPKQLPWFYIGSAVWIALWGALLWYLSR
jgi:hypothetical protein